MEYILSVISLPKFSLRKLSFPFASFGRHIHDHFIPAPANNYHPHVLSHKNLGLFSGLLVSVKIFSIIVLSFGPVLPAFSSAITVSNIITLTNESRQQFSESALTENLVLDLAAQTKANNMLAKGYFSHNTPEGHTPWDFITGAGYSYLMAGENLAVNFTEAENVETAWMNSPGHKANILNKNFEEIGIGIAQGQYQNHTAIFVVQMFGTPVAQKVTINDIPTKVQTAPVPAPIKANLTQVKGANSSANALPKAVAINSGEVKLNASNVNITAQVSGPAVKVTAQFGQQAIMLKPQSGNTWSGEVAVANLVEKNSSVKLVATGMQGQSGQLALADFSATTQDNYNLSGSTPKSYFNLFGYNMHLPSAEKDFYLFFIAGLLASLVLAIAIKRHVQHLSLIANSSFVIILAMLLWWGG